MLRDLSFNNFVSTEIEQNKKNNKPTMLDVKYSIKSLISNIYECQKKIIINKRFIRELESEGSDITKLRNEILELEQKISDYQKELRKKYQFSY